MHIRQFQEMMRQIYFDRDCRRGKEETYNWLVDEVMELGQALKANNRNSWEEEFADVIAWLASLANITKVDLEKATLDKYSNKCPKCKCSPCECPFLA
jgi:NTP pyrophosphatase (non-canonical NTP hydrolase)